MNGKTKNQPTWPTVAQIEGYKDSLSSWLGSRCPEVPFKRGVACETCFVFLTPLWIDDLSLGVLFVAGPGISLTNMETARNFGHYVNVWGSMKEMTWNLPNQFYISRAIIVSGSVLSIMAVDVFPTCFYCFKMCFHISLFEITRRWRVHRFRNEMLLKLSLLITPFSEALFTVLSFEMLCCFSHSSHEWFDLLVVWNPAQLFVAIFAAIIAPMWGRPRLGWGDAGWMIWCQVTQDWLFRRG